MALQNLRSISLCSQQDCGFLSFSSRPWQTRYGLTFPTWFWRFQKAWNYLFAFKMIDLLHYFYFHSRVEKGRREGKGVSHTLWPYNPELFLGIQFSALCPVLSFFASENRESWRVQQDPRIFCQAKPVNVHWGQKMQVGQARPGCWQESKGLGHRKDKLLTINSISPLPS